MNLKGQNFRLLVYDKLTGNYKVVAKSTSVSVTLTGNTEDASHKDITGMASAPTIVSKGWSLQAESLDVTDIQAMLYATKNMVPFTVRFDETSTRNNQTELNAPFGREGLAYITDLSLAFNNRANATKSFQMSGTGPLNHITETVGTELVPTNTPILKGQHYRLFLAANGSSTPSSVIAAALQLTLHLSVSLEDATTKDTVGDWIVQEPTNITFDITSNALMRSGEPITSQVGAQTMADVQNIFEGSSPVNFEIAYVNGDNNRTKGTVFCSGQVIVTNMTLNGPNRANADYSTTLNGFGELVLSAGVPSIDRISFSLPITQPQLVDEDSPFIAFDPNAEADDLVQHLSISLRSGASVQVEELSPSSVSVQTGSTHLFDMSTINGGHWDITNINDELDATVIYEGIIMD